MTQSQILFDAAEKNLPRPGLKPKDAATLIIIRRDRDALRVLMGQRHAKMAFQPNRFVFPGGSIDPCDQRITVGGALRPDVALKVQVGITPARARGLALAAVRETFEETGIIVGEKCTHIPHTRARAWQRYFAHGIVPKLDRFTLVARAITPPGRTRRFDARFFMVDGSAIAHEVDATHQEELLRPAWLTLAEARALDLMSITRRALDEAEAWTVEGGARPIPFFRVLNGKATMSYL